MTNRTLFLLLGLGSWALCGLVAMLTFSAGPVGDRGTSRLLAALILLFAVGGIYFFIAAFSKTRHRFGHQYDEYTTFSCPSCKVELNYSQFPAFQNEMPCPKCGEHLKRDGGKVSGSLKLTFLRSPEVDYELSTGNSAPPSGPVTREAVRSRWQPGPGSPLRMTPTGGSCDFPLWARPVGWTGRHLDRPSRRGTWPG